MPVHLVPRYARRISVAVIVVTAALAAGFAGQAMADASSIAVATTTATPEQGIPVDLAFSGTNALTGPAEVEAIVRPAGGPACLTSYQEDQSTFPSEDLTILAPGAQTVDPGAYQATGSFRPTAPGAYQICAWLAQNQNSTDSPISPPGTLNVPVRGPQVSQLSVAVPKDLQPHVAFQVTYTTQTDQLLSLYSLLRPASEAPCPASFDADQRQNQPETTLLGFNVQQVFGGPVTTTATATQKTGLYIICTWVQGPNAAQVDGAATTPITVGTPTPPIPPKPGLSFAKATASHKHGALVSGGSASGFTGKLVISAACGSSTAKRTTAAHNRRFSSRLGLPKGCRSAKKVKLTVAWAGSSAFSKQSVTKTVAIAK